LLLLVPEIPVPPHKKALPFEVYDAILGRLAAMSPAALRVALDRWPGTVFSTAPLMASLRQALPPGLVDEASQGSCRWSWSAAMEEQKKLAEALAALHVARDELEAAAQLLARVGSSLLFGLLDRHLEADEALGQVAAECFQRLLDLNAEEAIRLSAQHSSTFKPASVLALLHDLGPRWELQYLRLLLEEHPAAAHGQSLHLARLTAELQPQNLRSLLELLCKTHTEEDSQEPHEASKEAQLDENLLEQLLVITKSCRATDATALVLLLLGRQGDACRMLLSEGDMRWAISVAAASEELWMELLAASVHDARLCSSLLDCLTDAATPPAACAKIVDVFRRLPPGLPVPRLPDRARLALEQAEADQELFSLSLQRMKRQASVLSKKIYRRQRQGRAQQGRVPRE